MMRAMHRNQKVFIIHGWSYNLDKWQAIIPELRKLGLEPVMLKVPGLTEPSDKVWDAGGYVNWLDGKLKGEAEPIVVGHSNGGRIALSYIQAHPDRIKKLILIDSAGLTQSSFYRTVKLRILYILSKLAKPFRGLPLIRPLFYKIIGARDYYEAPAHMRQTMQNMLDADKKIDLKSIKLPVTIIWGRKDSITPLKDGQRMHRFLQGSTMEIIDDARHAPQATHPELVAGMIEKAVKG